jgi:hypothetical protein
MKVQVYSAEESERIIQRMMRGGYQLHGHIDVWCRNPDGSVAWEDHKSNLITDVGRRNLLANGFGQLVIFTSPSTEVPLSERFSLFDVDGASQASTVLSPTINTATLVKTWSYNFPTPATPKTIACIGLASGRDATLGIYGIRAYTLRNVISTQNTNQTLEAAYKIAFAPAAA